MVSLILVSFSLAFIMHLTSVYLVPLLLLGCSSSSSSSSLGLPEPGTDFARGKVSQIPEPEDVAVVVSKRSVKVEGDDGSGIADSNHQSVSSYHQAQEEDKKRGNYLIQEYLVSFLPYCPNGYQITIEPDQATPLRKGRTAGILSEAGEEAAKYILCQQNGRAKIKVSSHHSDENGRVNQAGGQMRHEDRTPTTYWITKAEAMTPLQDEGLYTVDSLDADAEESRRTKELMDTNCLPRKCPSNQLMAINTKNHMDCSSFYICIMGHHFLLHCPQAHLFSEEYGVCVENKYSDCQVKAACTNRL